MFHLVTVDAPAAQWDSINVWTQQNPGGFIASNSAGPPAGVAWNRWCRIIFANDWLPNNWSGLVAAIRQILDSSTAARVLLDELRSNANNDTRQLIANVAANMPASYANRWGSYLVTGQSVSYDNLNATHLAMNYLFGAGAIVVPEFYVPHHTFVNSSNVTVNGYWESGSTSAARDAWMAKWFNGATSGGFGQYKFPWLVAHRQAVWNSPYQRANQLSLIPPVFAVHSNWQNGSTTTSRSKFLDRMFYVWINHTGYPASIYGQYGGPGAWHWRDSPTNLDGTYYQSAQHYCVAPYLTSSRLGDVTT